MRGYKCEDACGNKKNVGYEKPRDRERTHLRATTHQALEALPNQGNFTDGVGSYSSGKISPLVPGKQVAGEGHRQDQTEENASREPEQLAPPFVRPADEGLRGV